MTKITLEELLEQIERIPSEWLDEVGREVIDTIPKIVEELKKSGVNKAAVKGLLFRYKYALDVFRLVLGLSQDEMINELLYFAKIPGLGRSFRTIRNRSKQHGSELAEALVENLGLADATSEELFHQWKYTEVLIERYKYQRGRAIKGQKRGRSLEDEVEELLKEIGATYESRKNFISEKGLEAKADFSIPSHLHPQIVIETKGYEATGSKLTDVLGDILKIVQAKDPDTSFYLVTDGVGWFRRISDLKHIIELQNKGDISMVYTRKTLPNLGEELKRSNIQK
ncbi:MAG: type II restriction endonuclease [Candidatus Bathyarchaeota archaeon]|nr:type II restriction endonuclease [Candidatus Bathyarchaeota archaeon]